MAFVAPSESDAARRHTSRSRSRSPRGERREYVDGSGSRSHHRHSRHGRSSSRHGHRSASRSKRSEHRVLPLPPPPPGMGDLGVGVGDDLQDGSETVILDQLEDMSRQIRKYKKRLVSCRPMCAIEPPLTVVIIATAGREVPHATLAVTTVSVGVSVFPHCAATVMRDGAERVSSPATPERGLAQPADEPVGSGRAHDARRRAAPAADACEWCGVPSPAAAVPEGRVSIAAGLTAVAACATAVRRRGADGLGLQRDVHGCPGAAPDGGHVPTPGVLPVPLRHAGHAHDGNGRLPTVPADAARHGHAWRRQWCRRQRDGRVPCDVAAVAGAGAWRRSRLARSHRSQRRRAACTIAARQSPRIIAGKQPWRPRSLPHCHAVVCVMGQPLDQPNLYECSNAYCM
jgi:hypothetical protein